MSTPTLQKPAHDDDPITRPIHDEWGVYDPEQAGFQAILRKLSAKKKAPTAEDAIWMTPASVPKPGSK